MKNKQQRQQIITKLEQQNKFDVDYLPQGKRYITPDENYTFVRKNVFYKASCKVVRSITFLFGPLVCKLGKGLKVRGRENLKGVRGAICVCNHIAVLDTLYVKQAVGYFRSYHTGAPWNNKRGLGGALMRRAGFLSLGGNIGAMRNFKKTVGELLQKGAIVNYYPEQALWQDYEKPRPLKSGAFRMAAEFDVPVVPMFVTFEGRHKHPVVNVLKPIEPKQDLCVRDSAQQMRQQCEQMWRTTYEQVYGKPLCYEKTDIAC